MRTLKKLAISLVTISLVVIFSSCEKQARELQEVSFSIDNVSNNLKKAVPQDDRIPVCKDDAPAYVKVKIDDKEYVLDILSGLNDGTETQVIKLDAGSYTIASFGVYSADSTLIWATPKSGSYYANLFGINGVSFDFTIEPFVKKKIDIDVLCWQDYDYDFFGFSWFDFGKVEIKTLCFFGDVCVDHPELWHNDGIYYQQAYDGYDFPAIFEVFITNEAGDTINDTSVNSNLIHTDGTPWQGIGDPLCIEYPNYVGSVDNYEFHINLLLPNGDSFPIASEAFTAEQGQIEITGDDGIYDFNIGALCDGIIPPPVGDSPPPPNPVAGCETAFAKFNNVDTDDVTLEVGYIFTSKANSNPELYPTLNISTRWGWAGNLKDDGTYTYPIWAAAGNNNPSNGYQVGSLEISKDGNNITVTYDMLPGYENNVIHIYGMDTPPTSTANGNYTYGDSSASGVFENLSTTDKTDFSLTFTVTDDDGDGIWFIAHSEVCEN